MLHFQQQLAVGGEYPDSSQARPMIFILRTRVTLCVRHYDVAAHILNSERNVVSRQRRVLKAFLPRPAMKMSVVDLHIAGSEVGNKKARSGSCGRDGTTLKNGLFRVVYHANRFAEVYRRIPAGNRAVFGDENKDRRLSWCDLKTGCVVENSASWSRWPLRIFRRRNRHHQGLDCPIQVIQG